MSEGLFQWPTQKGSLFLFFKKGAILHKTCFPSFLLIVRYLAISGITTPRKIPFKSFSPEQPVLLPSCLDEMVPASHTFRIVDRVIGQINIHPLISTSKGGVSSGYHPCMLLKVIVYNYLRNIYSSRQIEDSLKENIC